MKDTKEAEDIFPRTPQHPCIDCGVPVDVMPSDQFFLEQYPMLLSVRCPSCLIKKSEKEIAVPQPSDPINPSHYKSGSIECIEAMRAMLSEEEFRGFLRGNSFKYRWRYRQKNGVEDLKRAEWYEQKLLELEGK